MTVSHEAPIRNTLSAAVLTALGNSAILSFETAGGALVVAALSLPTTSGAVSAELLTFGAFTPDTDAAAGTVAEFAMQTSSNVDVLRGSVTLSGGDGDIIMSSLIVGLGDTVSCSSLTYASST